MKQKINHRKFSILKKLFTLNKSVFSIFLSIFFVIVFSLVSDAKTAISGPCIVNAGPDKVICHATPSLMLTATGSGGTAPRTYSWKNCTNNSNMSDYSYTETNSTLTISPLVTTTYSVSMTDSAGCTITDSVVVYVLPKENLLANGDYEISQNPSLRGEIEKANGWLKVSGDPDLFDTNFTTCDISATPYCGMSPLDYGCIGIPCNHFGNLEIRNQGNKYAGLWAAGTITSAYVSKPIIITTNGIVNIMVESMVHPVNLVAGKQYKLGLYVARAEKGETDTVKISPQAFFKIKLNVNQVQSNLKYQPAITSGQEFNGSVSSTYWQYVSYSFTADSNYQYIIIESDAKNFVQLNLFPLDPLKSNYSENGIQSYMYIDDIEIEEICSFDALTAHAGVDKKICKGNSTMIGGSPTATGAYGTYSYQWLPNTFINNPTIANPTVNPLVTTTYTVTITDLVRNTTSTDQVKVYVSNMVINAGPDVTKCGTNSVVIGGIAIGGLGNYTYNWTPTTGLSSATIAKPIASPSSTTNYNVTVTDEAGCSKNDFVNVVVTPAPSVNAGSDQTVCEGSNATLNASTNANEDDYDFEWQSHGTIISYNKKINISLVKTDTLTFKVFNKTGCYVSDDVVIYVNPAPNIASFDVAKCVGSGSVTIGSIAIHGTPPYTYSWSDGSTTTPTRSVNPSSTTCYTESVRDSKGCTRNAMFKVEVNPTPTANAGDNTTICPDSNWILGGTHVASGGTSPYTYSWASSTGVGFTNNAQKTLAHPLVNPTQNTTFTLTVTDAKGCTATSQVIISVNNTCPASTLKADAGDDWSGCGGTSHSLGGNSTASGGIGPYTYIWSPATGLSNINAANPVVSTSGEFQGTYQVVVTDNTGHTSKDIVTVTMTSPVANAGGDRTICQNYGTMLGVSECAYKGTPPLVYDWTTNNGSQKPASIREPGINPQQNTSYYLKVTDKNGCTSRDTVSVSVIPSPSLSAGPNKSICGVDVNSTGDSVSIGNIATGGTAPYTYYWSPAYGLSSTNSAIIKAFPKKKMQYWVTVIDANGCSANSTVEVRVGPKPILQPGSDKIICKGSSVQIGDTASNGTKSFSYLWTPSNGLSNPNIAKPTASPTATTEYNVLVTDANGCTARDTIKVFVESKPQALIGDNEFICLGESISIGGYATGDTAGVNYYWTSNPMGGPYPNTAFITISPSDTTTYTQYATGSGTLQCQTSDQLTVNVYQPTELIINKDFELGTVPFQRGDITRSLYWYPVTGNPDLFDRDAHCLPDPAPQSLDSLCSISPLDINCVGIPCNHFGHQEHETSFSGHRYAGLATEILVDATITNQGNQISKKLAVEGLGTRLSTPLEVGKSYTISFYANLSKKSEIALEDSSILSLPSQFFVKLSTDSIHSILFQPTEHTANFSGIVTDKNNWVKYTFPFVADSAYSYLNIETSGDELEKLLSIYEAKTRIKLQKGNLFQSYMYIDQVSLTDNCEYEIPLTVNATGGNICQTACINLNSQVNNGVKPYTYSWSPTTGMATGESSKPNPKVCATANTTYTVLVTDMEGNTASNNIIVKVGNADYDYVSNGDFSEGSVPLIQGDIEKAAGWKTATGTPDLMDSNILCSPCLPINDIDIPNNYFGTQSHRQANQLHRYAGLYHLYFDPNDPDRPKIPDPIPQRIKDMIGPINPPGQPIHLSEGIEEELILPLDTTKKYKISYYASLAEYGEVNRGSQNPANDLTLASSIQIAVKMSENFTDTIRYKPTSATIIHKDNINNSTKWQKVEFTFKPSKPYKYLILETSNVLGGDEAYVYLDDIKLQEACVVENPPEMVVNAGNDFYVCNSTTGVSLGGSPTATGGTTPYTYSWTNASSLDNAAASNPIATPSSTTSYTLIVTDANGMMATDDVTVYFSDLSYNYVPNGGFSAGLTPIINGQIDFANDWKASSGTPDLFDSTSTCLLCASINDIGIPKNYLGFQHHRLNDYNKRYAGLWYFNIPGKDTTITVDLRPFIPDPLHSPILNKFLYKSFVIYRSGYSFIEGIEVPLSQALDINKTYKVKYYASKAEWGKLNRDNSQLPSEFSLATDIIIDTKLSETFEQNQVYASTTASAIHSDVISDTINWQKVEFTFQPSKPFQYLILETAASYGGSEGYVYIDDVEIIEVCNENSQFGKMQSDHLIASKQNNVQNKIDPTVKDEMLVYPNPNRGGFNVSYFSSTDSEPVQISVYNLVGQELRSIQVNQVHKGLNTLSVDLGNDERTIPTGLYLVRLKKQNTIIVKTVQVIH